MAALRAPALPAQPCPGGRFGRGAEPPFWHWQSTFDAPPGRERELADMVGTGVYDGGFEGLRAYLRRSRHAPDRSATVRGLAAGEAMHAQGVVVSAFGGPEVLRHQ